MPSYRDILQNLLAQAPENLSDDDLAELAASAQTMARLGVTPPAAKPAPQQSLETRQTAARARLRELDAEVAQRPNMSDREKHARVDERLKLYGELYETGGDATNGHFWIQPRTTPGDAA